LTVAAYEHGRVERAGGPAVIQRIAAFHQTDGANTAVTFVL
jgi:hypothetical protein